MAYRYFLNNPCGKQVGDCVIRAISSAMNMPWRVIYKNLCELGSAMCDLPNSNAVWSSYLRKNGFKRYPIEDCTIREFSSEFPLGTYILSTGNHVVSCIDGMYYDAWDSGNEFIESYWRKEI